MYFIYKYFYLYIYLIYIMHIFNIYTQCILFTYIYIYMRKSCKSKCHIKPCYFFCLEDIYIYIYIYIFMYMNIYSFSLFLHVHHFRLPISRLSLLVCIYVTINALNIWCFTVPIHLCK